MLAYVTLGTNNKEKALAFYDAVLGEMGAKRFSQTNGCSFTASALASRCSVSATLMIRNPQRPATA